MDFSNFVLQFNSENKAPFLVFWEKGNFLHLTLAGYVQTTSEGVEVRDAFYYLTKNW